MNRLISGLIKLTLASALVVTLASCGGAEERKAKYLEKGISYLEAKNYDKARVEFKNVMQIDPKFADVYYYVGQLEEHKKEMAKAVGNYKKAIELDPSHVKAKIELSKIYVLVGTDEFIEKAKKYLSEIKQAGETTSKSEIIRATIEYKTGSEAKAIALLKKLIAKDKKLDSAIVLLTNIYTLKEEYNKVKNLLDEAITNNPENVQMRVLLAQLYANKLDDLDTGEKLLIEAVSLEPENYSLQVGLAAFFARVSKLDKAEAVLKKSIKQNPDDVQRYLRLVEFLSTRVSLKRADEELENAINSNPNLYMLKFAQVRLYSETGNIEKAKNILIQVIADKHLEVEGLKAHTLLAGYLLKEGDKVGAKKHIDEVLAEHPNDNDALLIDSKLALVNFDSVAAINGLRTVLKNNPKDSEASLLLAQAHELNKDSALAESVLKKAIEANPIDDKVHVNYARYLGSKGRIDEAVEVVDKALAYFKNNYDLLNVKLKIIASQGKESEIIPLLNLMEQANSKKTEVNITKGKYYLSKGDSILAIKEFEKAYAKSRDKYPSLKLIVQTYLAAKQPENAHKRLQNLLDVDKNNPVANLLMGQLYIANKKFPQAREKFKLASKSAETWFIPYSNLATLYLIEKNPDEALKVYQNALSKLKNKAPAQMQIAAIYETKKNYSAAMKVYQQILLENPADKLAANNYASLLLDFGSESTADGQKALELTKGFEKFQQPALLDTLAWAHAKTGDNAAAVLILKPIVEKHPEMAIFRYHLGYALYQIGDKAAAKSHLEIASSSKQKFPGKDKAAELLKGIIN